MQCTEAKIQRDWAHIWASSQHDTPPLQGLPFSHEQPAMPSAINSVHSYQGTHSNDRDAGESPQNLPPLPHTKRMSLESDDSSHDLHTEGSYDPNLELQQQNMVLYPPLHLTNKQQCCGKARSMQPTGRDTALQRSGFMEGGALARHFSIFPTANNTYQRHWITPPQFSIDDWNCIGLSIPSPPVLEQWAAC